MGETANQWFLEKIHMIIFLTISTNLSYIILPLRLITAWPCTQIAPCNVKLLTKEEYFLIAPYTIVMTRYRKSDLILSLIPTKTAEIACAITFYLIVLHLSN